ncbi:MAG: hypothetical protein EOP24_20110 [Hyphomicrobiales bacterium]|jgi:hypothetical protein|nr:MAG: hypothetical protein EOP24_20110 [Hyphomicrobiales bacterium]
MTERPEIELSRERGEWTEQPRGPLDKPRVLLGAMLVFGIATIVVIVMSFVSPRPYAVLVAVPLAFLLGVAVAGRFPGAFFGRKGR